MVEGSSAAGTASTMSVVVCVTEFAEPLRIGEDQFALSLSPPPVIGEEPQLRARI